MEPILSPTLVFLACALGAAGLCLALPRKGISPQVIGALIAGAAGGLVIIALTATHWEQRPNLYFYIFSVVALGSALRVITHPKPVYAALYFILTIVSSAGLYLLLSAEFMAFALLIVYAGAILITYLFVIMLATQAPAEGEEEVLADYDVAAREPIAAAVVAFALLATLTGLGFQGAAKLNETREGLASIPSHPAAKPVELRDEHVLGEMPRRLRDELNKAGVEVGADEKPTINWAARTVTLKKAGEGAGRMVALPAGLSPQNVESVGFNLLKDHPGSIEIAGVILLMAMLGAVVLSRKQVELDEAEKARQARHLTDRVEGGAA